MLKLYLMTIQDSLKTFYPKLLLSVKKKFHSSHFLGLGLHGNFSKVEMHGTSQKFFISIILRVELGRIF